eukprot:scaffold2093_cov96-Isochrysis_galbana.AAC.4
MSDEISLCESEPRVRPHADTAWPSNSNDKAQSGSKNDLGGAAHFQKSACPLTCDASGGR